MTLNRAFFVLRCRADLYGPDLPAAAEEMLISSGDEAPSYELGLADLKPGMTLMVDIVSETDSLLVAAGSMLSEALLERLRKHDIEEPIVVDRPWRDGAA
jgi:hypothetical protein